MDICIQNLTKRFGEKIVFRDFSIVFPSGITSTIMGKSGVGKTTLMRILLGLESYDSGHIYGIPKKKAVVFQENRLLEELSAFSNIKLTASKEKDIHQALEKLGLGDSMHLPVKELSGGMKRRVSLARALLSSYELLILDEPFSGLDEKTKMKTADFIREENYHRTCLFITHDRNDASLLNSSNILSL